MDDTNQRKPTVVFPFVEAGFGHIMPMQAVADAFEKKYGDRAEVIRVNFFRDTGDARLEFVENEFVREVKLHNKIRGRGLFQFLLMRLFGQKASLRYLMQCRYKQGFLPALDYLETLNADLIFSTHFSTLYYACEARERGLIHSRTAVYCPDPILGRQWDRRADFVALSSLAGSKKAIAGGGFAPEQVKVTPFLIREAVKNMTVDRKKYRRKLGLPENDFTVLLCDGAYGAGKLKKTVLRLLKSKQKMTVIAVCGKNENLFQFFKRLNAPQNILFVPYGFTDKTLTLAAACDVFVGKAGASNLAEPCYFGAPQIVTFRATPIERWIAAHYVKYVKSALLVENVGKAVKLVESWAEDRNKMKPFEKACESQHRSDGPELLADEIWRYAMRNDCIFSLKKSGCSGAMIAQNV